MPLPTSSVVTNITLAEPEPAQPVVPQQYLFSTFDEMMAWRASLSTKEEEMLYWLDKKIASMVPDDVLDVDQVIKSNHAHFYRCLYYIIIGCSRVLQLSISSDYKRFTKMHTIEVYNPAC